VSDLVDGSRVVSAVRRASRTSRVLGALRTARTRLAISVDTSRLVSAVDRVGSTLGSWTRSSWLDGWLTTEPDPDVVVIDLRETYTVGPLIAALDRVAGWVGPRWRGSAPHRGLQNATRWIGRTVEHSRTGRVLAVLLVPSDLDDEE
jgi:hypothetical protein